MGEETSVDEVAEELLAGVGLLVRRLRQLPAEGDLSAPQRWALSRLGRAGPATSAELAREAQITAQSMGATLAALGTRALVQRRADPDDGRRVLVSVTEQGLAALAAKRHARARQLAAAMVEQFTAQEIAALGQAAPLLERLGRGVR